MNPVNGFKETFGCPPLIAASAPGRVNLIGEHTDYNGGAVLPAALERRIQIAMAKNDAPTVVIKSTRFDKKIERPVGDPKRGDWTDYAMGALWKAGELGWLQGGVFLHIESDVPDGAGVSSSAALITAILRAAAIIGQVATTAVDIAKYARVVENDYIGMPCGIMDQMAVGLTPPGSALALNTRTLDFEIIEIPASWRFVTIHSGIRRELADGRYAARFEECQAAADQLGTDTLCLLTDAQLEAMTTLPENLMKRARHAVSEHIRTLAARDALSVDDIDRFADLMNASHQSYARDFEASTPVIDALIEDALRMGAKGARLTGGGFGGCIVALIAADAEPAWTNAFLAQHPACWRV